MPDIVKELNLNKHPKNCKNLSLVYAKNVQVSNDLSCIHNEEAIYEHTTLINSLTHKTIVGYIPCNKEIIFITTDTVPGSIGQEVNAYIERYNELENQCKCVYNNYKYYGGEIKGTFTYNINSELIIAITEFDYNDNLSIPLRTINLGKWEGNAVDVDLSYEDLAINPDVKIPSINDFSYISGTAYKGWYNFFIRFKLNNRDYTKWYHIGYPILLDEIFNSTVFRYYQPDKLVTNKEYLGSVYGGDAYAKTSTIYDICSKTIRLDLGFDASIEEKTYQIGFICSSKNYTKAYKTTDMIVSPNEAFTIDFNILDEYSVSELILDNYNYYNVKNVINYKNKLYISNYKDSLFDYNSLQTFVRNNCNIQIMNDESIILFTNPDESDLKRVDVSFNVKNDNNQTYATVSGDILNTDVLNVVVVSGGTLPRSQNILDGTCVITFDDDTQQNASLQVTGNRGRPNYAFRIMIRSQAYTLEATAIFNYINGVPVSMIIQTRQDYIGRNPSSSSVTDKYDYTLLKETTLIPGEKYNFYIHFVNKYGEVSEGIKLTEEPITIPKDYGTRDEMIKYYPKINITSSIPNGFGYFLSYEKLQKIKTYSGVFHKEVYDGKTTYKFYSGEIDLLDSINIQGNSLEIIGELQSVAPHDEDAISQVRSKGIGDVNTELDVRLLEENYFYWNINNYSLYSQFQSKSIKSIEVVGAEDYSKGNNGKGSYLKITLQNTNNDDIDEDTYYLANINNYNSGQYKNEIKTLIKFTNVIYTSGEQSFKYGLNGRITLNDVLLYNKEGVVLDTSLNVIFTNLFKPYYSSTILSKNDNKRFLTNYLDGSDEQQKTNDRVPAPLVIFSFYEYSDILLEGKRINNAPQFYPLNATVPSTGSNYVTPTFITNIITEPKNSVDLFKEVNGNQDDLNPLTWVNYDENIEHQNEFNKRIQRSNVIQDESLVNSWRFFPVEGYKDITENKGVITNLIGIGTTFLAHTEHSLFMFDRDNTLQTEGKDVQLAMPDIFDVDYREVFTSELGTAGLQDSKAFVADTFGYVFYDNDDYSLYLFGEKQLKVLDFNCVEFLKKYRPHKVRFANDKSNNRILLDIQYKDIDSVKEIVLSYSTILNKLISFHTHNFEEATNTKNNIYLFKNLKAANTKIYHPLHDWKNGNRDVNITNVDSLKNQFYNHFENTYNNFSANEKSQIDIIVNDAYEVIKYLEFITYKLYNIEKGDNLNNVLSFPVEEMRTPYAGLKIRVYNGNNTADRIDTGWIDISNATWENKDNSQSPMQYKLPYWHNGNWNFNYLRDILNQKDSRLWGNYFVISFEFGRELTRTEFETLGYSITKSENI